MVTKFDRFMMMMMNMVMMLMMMMMILFFDWFLVQFDFRTGKVQLKSFNFGPKKSILGVGQKFICCMVDDDISCMELATGFKKSNVFYFDTSGLFWAFFGIFTPIECPCQRQVSYFAVNIGETTLDKWTSRFFQSHFFYTFAWTSVSPKKLWSALLLKIKTKNAIYSTKIRFKKKSEFGFGLTIEV